jgi:hypothetical protein
VAAFGRPPSIKAEEAGWNWRIAADVLACIDSQPGGIMQSLLQKKARIHFSTTVSGPD